MLAQDAQKNVPSLKLEQLDGSYWLTANSTFKGNEAKYYFGLSDEQPPRINRIFIGGSRSTLGENAANLRTWCIERPNQLRSEFLRILGRPPSGETGWINEDIPSDVTSYENLEQMCRTAFRPRPDVDDPLLQLRCQGFSKLGKQSFQMYGNGHNNEKVSIAIEYLLRCVKYVSGFDGRTIASPCEVTCTTKFDLYF